MIEAWHEVYTTDTWVEFGVLMAILLVCVGLLCWIVQSQRKRAMSAQYTVKLKTGETFTTHKTAKDWAADGFFNHYFTVDVATWCEPGIRVKVPRHNLAWSTFKQLPAKK